MHHVSKATHVVINVYILVVLSRCAVPNHVTISWLRATAGIGETCQDVQDDINTLVSSLANNWKR